MTYSDLPMRRRTLYEHQQCALDTLGMTRFDFTLYAPRVMDALCDEMRACVDRDHLLAQARIILYERRYVIPASRTAGELAKRARETVEREVVRRLSGRFHQPFERVGGAIF